MSSDWRLPSTWFWVGVFWKRKLLQAASILRHSDGDYKVLIEIGQGCLCMVLIGPPEIEAHTVACPAAETTGFWICVKNVDKVVCKNMFFSLR